MFRALFKIGGQIAGKQRMMIEIIGFVFFVFIWWLVTHPFHSPNIQYNAVGGQAPYKFELKGPGGFSYTSDGNSVAGSLATGSYTLSVTDGNGAKNLLKLDVKTDSTYTTVDTAANTPGIRADISIRKPFINPGILPSPGDVLYSFKTLSAEKVNVKLSENFQISDDVLKQLAKDSIPTEVINKLKPLVGKSFSSNDELTTALNDILTPAQNEDFSYQIVNGSFVGSYMGVSSLVFNTSYSIMLNILGYLWAIVLSLMVGFLIALVPFFRGLLSRYIDAVRFIPLAAVTGLFIAWFGIELNMKLQFLAFGIFVFLLPVVVQRIDEVDRVYKQTAFTLGATDWQMVRFVYWPSVISKLIDDMRVLTAISWTYIIVAETVNKDNGIGALIFTARRHSRLDEVFALLLLIIIIGFVQDLLFTWIDKKVNPHKYA